MNIDKHRNGTNSEPVIKLPRAQPGRVERVENRRELRLLACPTCKESVWFVSVNERYEVHLECAVCSPAPAVKLTLEHLRAALVGL